MANCFIQVWNSAKENLLTFGNDFSFLSKSLTSQSKFSFLLLSLLVTLFVVAFQGITLPQKFHDAAYSGELTLDWYLPSTDGPGICPLLLTAYLIELNNTTIESYARAKDIKYAPYTFLSFQHFETVFFINCFIIQ